MDSFVRRKSSFPSRASSSKTTSSSKGKERVQKTLPESTNLSSLGISSSVQKSSSTVPSSSRKGKERAQEYIPIVSIDNCQNNASPSHDTPTCHTGAVFDINWDKIYQGNTRLDGTRVGFRPLNKRHLKGKAKRSPIYEHGADLVYVPLDGKTQKVWLCRICHLSRNNDCARFVDGTSHIVNHLSKTHKIHIRSDEDESTTPIKAAFLQQQLPSHQPYDEEHLSTAHIDWTILLDQSFSQATCAATRGLMTWQRLDLLSSLPANTKTLHQYILESLEERQQVIVDRLQIAKSRIHLSFDIWSSSNGLPLIGVVGHFIGM
jgi:hypothetical protein